MRSLISRLLISLILLTPVFAEAAAVDTEHKLSTVEDALIEQKANIKDSKVVDDLKPKLEELKKLEEAAAVEDRLKAGAINSEAVSDKPTKFNGIEVLPIKELTGENFDKETKNGYWFVKHYSPYYHYCKAVAPT